MTTQQKLKTFFSHRIVYLVLIAIVAVFIVNLLAYSYLKTEKAIYYWDISAYWKNSIDLLVAFRADFGSGITALQQSITSDYNYLPLIPILPIMGLIGSSRTIFVLSILNVYIVPFALITTYALSCLFTFQKSRKAVIFYATMLPILLFFPSVLAPVFDGRVDGIGLLFMSLILLLYVKTRFSQLWHFIILGALICCMFIARRYYSFWALGFFLAFITVTLVSTWLHNKRAINRAYFKALFKPALGTFIAGITILVIMLVGFREIFLRYIGENYADMYSAYHLGSFGDQILLFIRNFGVIAILLMITGLVISFVKYRRTIIHGLTWFLTIQALIVFLAFTHTQTFGIHHYYMLTPLFLWSFAVLVKYFVDLKNSHVKYLAPAGLLAVVVFLSLFSFIGQRKDTVIPLHQYIFGLSENIRPIVRHDLATLRELSTYLATTMKPSEYVYILSSSDTFNDDIFRNISLPEQPPINVSGVAHVDKRDGFPNYFFDAQYIIVANPIQTHIEADGQSVITLLAQKFLNGEARNITALRTFTIDRGITLTVYKKESPYSTDFVKGIHNYFAEKYPTYPSLNDIRYSGQ